MRTALVFGGPSMVRGQAKRLWQALNRVTSFTGQISLTLGTNVLLILLGLVTGIVIARLLGPEGRGELAVIQMWADALRGIALLGVHEALAYYAALAPQQAGRSIGSAVLLGFSSAMCFMGIGSLLLPALLSAQAPEVISAARWYLLQLPLAAIIAVPYHALRGRGDFVAWNLLRLLPGMGWLATIGFMGALGYLEPATLALAYLVTTACLALPILSMVARRVSGPFWPDVRQWRPMARYGLLSVGATVPQVLNLRLDQMLMAGVLPAQMLGLYVVGVTWSGAVAPVLGALGVVLFSRLAAQSDAADQRRAFAQGGRIAVLVAGLVGLLVAVCTPWAITLLFGRPFLAAIPSAIVLVVAAVFLGISQVLEDGLRGLGHPHMVLLAECGGLVVTVLALVLLLPPLAIMGAALASLCGYATTIALLVLQARRLTGIPASTFLVPTRHDIALSWQHGRSLLERLMPRA